MNTSIPDKLYFSLYEACKIIGFSYPVGEREIREGHLQTILIGKRQKVARKALIKYLEVKGLI